MLKASCKKHILKFHTPAGTSRGYLSSKTSWIISLYDPQDPSIVGTGESSLIKGLSPDPEEDYEAMLTKVCANPEEYLRFFSHELNPFPSIRFGLEMAWQDLKESGKAILFKSAFTEGKAGIPINGLIWMGSKENVLQQIKARLQEGFRCIKMKIGALSFEEELYVLKKLRQEYSPSEIELRVDANGAFLPGEALEKLNRLSDFHLHSIEQPVKPGYLEIMAGLCKKTPLPIALDEELFSPGADENKIRLLETIKPHYLVLKPSMLGGFVKTQEWINVAKSMNIGWWVTSALESDIGLNALAQWTFTLNNPVHHGLGTGKLFVNNFLSNLIVENGFLKYHSVACKLLKQNSSILPGLKNFLDQWNQDVDSFVLHTSGSTGKPKEIMVSRKAMIRSAQLTGEALNLKKGETALLCMPLNFVAGKMMLVRALVLDLDLVIVKPSSIPLKEVSADTVLDFAAMTPMQVQESMSCPVSLKKLKAIKCLIIGGAPVSYVLEQKLMGFPLPVYESYGMTETLTHIALRRINASKRSEYFNTLQGVKISADMRGCLVIHAPHLDKPDVITNDLVEIISPNQFRWLGRAVNVINTGGIKVFPEQIEKKLERFIKQRFIITGLTDEKLGEKVVLVIEKGANNPEKSISVQPGLDKLPGIFLNVLSQYESPREIFLIEKFPESISGKVLRKEIQQVFNR